jgi:alpha-galactosidase
MIVEQYPDELLSRPVPVGRGGATLRSDLVVDDARSTRDVIVFRAGDSSRHSIVLEVPLGDAVAFWQPYGHWGRTTLPPDWRGATHTSLIRSTPMGCLYSHAGDTILGFALSETERRVDIRYGVSEENKTFVVCIDLPATDEPRELELRVTAGAPADLTIPELSGWLRERAGVAPLGAPGAASEPVYSTWYAYHHDVDDATLEAEADIAVELGLRNLFLDFGWQRHGGGRQFEGCGDWTADPRKFPDLPSFVERMHGRGLKVVAWVAPFLLGEHSDAFAALLDSAPHYDAVLNAHILDPRHRRVREAIVDQFVELVAANDLDGLKIDFLETAAVYELSPSNGDLADVSSAVQDLLAELRRRLAELGRDELMIEFRQPYVSPALRRFANILRAEDCPGDPVLNRTSILDARLSTDQVVHSDMMMWHSSAGEAQVVRHLHSSLFAVPQVSVPLSTMSPAHAGVVKTWLALWRELSPTLLGGALRAERPHSNFPLVIATDDAASRAVVVAYEPGTLIPVPDHDRVHVVAASPDPTLCLRVTGARGFAVTAVDIHGVEHQRPAIASGSVTLVDVPESGHLRLEALSS